MADKFLEELERRRQLAREAAEDYEKGVELAKEIAALQRDKEKHKADIVKHIEAGKEKVGTIARLGSALGALAPTDALYKLNDDLAKAQSQNDTFFKTLGKVGETVRNFEKNYAKSIKDNLKTAATGKDYNRGQKTYSDIIYDQMGVTKKQGFQVADIFGFAGDVSSDPGNVVSPLKIAYKAVSGVGTQAMKVAARAPKLKNLIDTMGRNLDVFYDVSKAYSEKTIFSIKAAVKDAAGSGDFTRLEALQKGGLVSAGGMNASKKAFSDLLTNMFPEKFAPKDAVIRPAQEAATTAFGKITTSIEKSLEVTNQGYKWLMTWSPRFQTRNIAGATFQNVSEYSTKELLTGKFVPDFIEAIKVTFNKGMDKATGEITPLWKAMLKSGDVGVEGIGGQGASKLPKAIAMFNENVQRYVSVLRETRYGKTADEAIAKTSSVLYEYNAKYMTPFMQQLSKFVPFLAYNVGQFKYMPEALQRLAAKYNTLAKLDKATESEFQKENPQLTPDYQKNQFMVSNIGNFGIQAEGFLRLLTSGVTDGFREGWSQLAPLFTTAMELASNWKVFEGKKISEDTNTKKYNESFILSAMMGDPGRTGEGNAYMKYIVEKVLGVVLSPLQKMIDSKQPWYSGLTSIRSYDNSPETLRRIQTASMSADRSGPFSEILSKMGFGPRAADAGPVPVTIDKNDPLAKWSTKEIQKWAKDKGISADVFGKEYVWGGGYEQTMFRQQSARWEEQNRRNLLNAGPDIGANYQNYAEETIRAVFNDARWSKRWDDPEFKKYLEGVEQALAWMRPRTTNEAGQFSSEYLEKYRRSMGKEPTDIAFNKAKEDWVAFIGKTADMLRAAAGTSYEDIAMTAAAEKRALKVQARAGNVEFSEEEIARRMAAIDSQAVERLRKLEGRANIATANILQAWANSTANEVEKLQIERNVAYMKFLGSDDYKSYAEDRVNGEKNFQKWKAAHEAEWDFKISQARVKQIEAYLNEVKAVAEGTAKETIQALDAAFARGGVSIPEYFKTKTATDTKASVETFSGITKVFKSQVSGAGAAEGLAKLEELEKMLSDPNVSPDKILEIYENIIEAMQSLRSSGNVVELQNVLTSAIKETMGLSYKIKANAEEMINQSQQLDKAIAEIKVATDQLRLETIKGTGGRRLPFEGGPFGTKFGKSTSPFVDDTMSMFDQMRAQADMQETQSFTKSASMYAGINTTIAGGFEADKKAGETDQQYVERIDKEIEFQKQREDLTAEGLRKIEALETASVERTRQINGIKVQLERDIWDAKLNIASSMAGQLANVAEAFYNASGKQSKEAFYVMKAAAFAEATVKGIQAVMAAYAAGMSIGTPAAPAFAAAYAGLAAAFVGVQLGTIIASAIAGPGKAEGGPIEGGSGHKDDVPIMGMGGEYVVRKSAVKKYGMSFMDAINRGLIDPDQLSFNIPTAAYPDYGKTHFADGGGIIASNVSKKTQLQPEEATNNVTIMNIMDPREIDRYLASAAGQNAILNVLSSRQQAVRKVLS